MVDADLILLDQFAKGLELLDDYDHEKLDQKGITTRQAKYPELSDCRNIIESMRRDFDFYPSIEEKAATLQYLIIKNHSFVDGINELLLLVSCCF